MRRRTSTALLTLLALAPITVAWKAVSRPLEMQPESRLWIAGSSTVRSFECRAAAFDAHIESDGSGAVLAILGGGKAVTGVEVRVPAERLECGNGTMNEHMRKALKAKENPVILFRLLSYDLAKAAEGVQLTLTGTLTLGGAERPVTITADAKEGENGSLRITGTHEIRMKEFGLKPPSLMFGTMRVDERVKVNFDFLLKD